MTFTKNIELTTEQIRDVIVTALEGGSNYWYFLANDSVKAIRDKVSKEENEYLSEAVTDAIYKGAVIPVYDIENPSELLGTLSKDSIEAGIQLMINNERDEIELVLDETYDAGDADVMFQYFVLGEIVFG